jgi:PTS system mannitol-specific IIC component
MRSHLKRGGAFLARMIMPNIGAFLAWGLITALFAPAGWLPNPGLATLISPMLLTLLPILIGYTGGHLVHDVRGGVVGAVATMGAIVGSDVPMFLGAMLIGPLAAACLRQIDASLGHRTPASFAMLAANFSAGLLGVVLAIAAFVVVGPAIRAATLAFGAGATALTASGLLPLLAVVIEPAKVLFLNNAINHGVLAPLGAAQANEAGRSIFFLLETNPGPGLGILLAYWIWGGTGVRQSAPGAIVVHFFGGIHEVYFPYVLMQPLTILAAIAGGVAANLTFVATGAGLVATPSPGSIFAELALAPRGGVAAVLLGICAATICSCLVAMPIVRRTTKVMDHTALSQAQTKLRELKAGEAWPPQPARVVFACDAGMGSSVLGAAVLERRLLQEGLGASVGHAAIAELRPTDQLVVVHASLADRVRARVPEATICVVDEFLNPAAYDRVVEHLSRKTRASAGSHA